MVAALDQIVRSVEVQVATEQQIQARQEDEGRVTAAAVMTGFAQQTSMSATPQSIGGQSSCSISPVVSSSCSCSLSSSPQQQTVVYQDRVSVVVKEVPVLSTGASTNLLAGVKYADSLTRNSEQLAFWQDIYDKLPKDNSKTHLMLESLLGTVAFMKGSQERFKRQKIASQESSSSQSSK